ncbi:TKL protein kinase [Aphanomyces invadans]|uniref:TKL protein kinase n=1 Tax=Aphanomyces invadans TaxID=157072 RepID=A0A024TVK0_9STRA|nr:TKL protein kinase [Aphanomyces invadans]ETV97651.1 TKL protein kinase [Aphanomyces invadans]|eukprot:XP_008873860.1 TKL protein kinase [Aphanomyces invadans]
MQFQAVVVAATAAAAAMAQTGAILPKCEPNVSTAFDLKMKNQTLVCTKDQNTTGSLVSMLSDVNLFCATPTCLKMLNETQAMAAVCRPNSTTLLPTKFCDSECRQKVTTMQLYSKNCFEVATKNTITYCTFCNKFSQEADLFVETCGLWDSATALRDTITEPRTICAKINTPVPTDAPSSSSTSYIIISAIGGVIVLGAIAYFFLKKKNTKYESDYRSAGGSHINSGGSRGGSSRGSPHSTGTNQLTQVTMQNDIRFDTELAQFRIPQQEIQNISLLVKGGYGVVFHATFNKIDVAMKQLLPSKAKDQNAIQDFMNEIRLCARLEHPKIVKFVGISWSTLQDLAVLSEFMANGDVTGLIRKERKKPDAQRLLHWVPHPTFGTSKTKIAADVIDALVYLHSFQPTVIHRDLKSKNVLLSDTWEAKLSDFGISRVTSLEETMTSNIGTVAWIAPEVLTGGRYTEKADIYSFGVLLSELDTLQVPYAEMLGKSKENGFSNARLAMMVSEGALQPTFTDNIPSQLHQLAKDCLNFHDTDRPTAMKLSYQLHSILKDFDSLQFA